MAKHYWSPAHPGQVIRQEGGADTQPEPQSNRRNILKKVALVIKLTIFLSIWLFCVICIIKAPPIKENFYFIPLEPETELTVDVVDKPQRNVIGVQLMGDLDADATWFSATARDGQSHLFVRVQIFDSDTNETKSITDEWKVYLNDNDQIESQDVIYKYLELQKGSHSDMQVSVLNKANRSLAVEMMVNANPINVDSGVICGVILLIFLCLLIAFEIVDQALAAIIVSTTAVAVLCLMGERQEIDEIITWVDMETMMLLFSMMMMVGIITETGIFEYLSIYVYRLSKGNAWLLMLYLCLFTAITSAFIDNVTTVLILLPLTFQLCDALALNGPVVIVSIALFSNIGGALTPIGDPPNVIIATDWYAETHNVNFGNFMVHMLPGVFLSIVFGFFVLYLLKRNKLTNEVAQQQQESNAFRNVVAYLKPPATGSVSNFNAKLVEMKEKFKIKNVELLIKCGIAFAITIILFILHSLPSLEGLTLCWAALLSAMLLLILANKSDIDSVLEAVDWSTLVFFAGLFVFMQALSIMGMIDWMGELIINAIKSVNKKHQLVVAILMVSWITAFGATLVGNIAITTMMLKLIIQIAKDRELNLPFTPLAWSLVYGACFGGNGSLIGAAANVIICGVARQHGHKITFRSFFAMGFPVMLTTMLLASIYLLIAHCAASWH